ncbi:hypothetical protein Tco_1091450 [Tanacetum coccineum]|uniref:Zinc finger, CCHC-type n=1 Tax=Tanacetum coccineum TaxID=301880 RepID=A0ABQ5I9F6_9ASTR
MFCDGNTSILFKTLNHSALRSMFEREKLSGNNFNDWFRQLNLVLRVEKKMYVIEQPIPLLLQLAEWNAVKCVINEELISMFKKQAGEKANKKSQNTKGKGKGKGKGKDKSYVPKPKNPKPNAKEHPAKNDACHHCKEVLTFASINRSLEEQRKLNKGPILVVGNGVRAQVQAYRKVSRLVENGFVQCFTDYGISVSRNNILYFNAIPSNGIYEIDMSNSISIEKAATDGLIKSTDDEV